MGDFRVAPAALASTARRWDGAAELMAGTARDLAAASADGLAPDVRDAARRFLQAWSGYAAESEGIARGLGAGLREVATDLRETDTRQGTDFHALDARLGPAR